LSAARLFLPLPLLSRAGPFPDADWSAVVVGMGMMKREMRSLAHDGMK